MTTALVIVHLSSLDAFTWTVGADTGAALASSLVQAIKQHRGAIYVIDQKWPLRGAAEQRPRRAVLAALARRKHVTLPFDEATASWDWFLPRLRGRLRRDGVTRVVLGGIWWTKHGRSGCVNATHRYLRADFDVTLDTNIVGEEE
jgi:hypothetical protein